MRHAILAASVAIVATLGLLAGCSSAEDAPAPLRGTGIGIDIEAMDKATAPGDDFYVYANGKWLETAQIPADRNSVGARNAAYNRTQERLTALAEELAASSQKDGTAEALVADYYRAFMDTEAIDKAGFAPMRADLERFAAISDLSDLSRVIGEQLRADVDPINDTDFQTSNLFGLFISRSASEENAVPYLLQGGLGMPDRNYYLSSEPEMASARAAYRAYVARVLRLAGYDRVASRAEAVLALETRIAATHMTRDESSEFSKRTAQWEVSDFPRQAPGMDWPAFFAASGLEDAGKIAVFHETAVPALSLLVASEPLDSWKDWLAFHQISSHAEIMPGKVRKAHFDFVDEVLAGRKAPRKRSELAFASMNGIVGRALGKIYVERHFSEEQRQDIEIMVGRIKAALADRIAASEWMAPETRRTALARLKAMKVGVGRPESFGRFEKFSLAGKSAYAMALTVKKAETARQLARIGKPIDQREWWLEPHAVNSVNLPLQNALNFPAAILQKPFYDPEADAASNYGGIGAMIGHEIVHGIDNKGAEFDEDGSLRNWWTNRDRDRFRQKAQALVRQYETYRPLPELAIDGERTLAENIADLSGLIAAYDAYRASLGGKEPPVIEGFTGDQRFFIAYAQSKATKQRTPALRHMLLTGDQAPDRYRVLTVRNVDPWYRAFNVQPGADLYLAPEDRIRIF